jgi:CBS-domain-containing membrane protein
MVRDDIAQTVLVGIQFIVLSLITWLVSKPLLFPSLGPSAYLLAAGEGKDEAASSPYHVIGGHLIAVIAGLLSYHTFASDLLITAVVSTSTPATSVAILRLGASSIVAMMLTTFGMLITDTNHPAACATTLIVSLGLLSALSDGVYIMLAVVLLVGVHEIVVYPVAARLNLTPDHLRD